MVLVSAYYLKGKVHTEDSGNARALYDQSRFGKITRNNILELSNIETLYLIQAKKLTLFDGRNKEIDEDSFLKKAIKAEANFLLRYNVFKDIRDRGYIIKTALKFGAEFRIYDRGVKPGEDHAKWVVFPVQETDKTTWYDYAAKNRVAHSTKKKLLIAVVDDEGDVSYWESRWIRP